MRPRPVSCVGWSTKVNNAVECSIKASLHVPLFFVCEADLTGTAVSSHPPPTRHFLLNQLLQALVIDLALRLVHREPSLQGRPWFKPSYQVQTRPSEETGGTEKMQRMRFLVTSRVLEASVCCLWKERSTWA